MHRPTIFPFFTSRVPAWTRRTLVTLSAVTVTLGALVLWDANQPRMYVFTGFAGHTHAAAAITEPYLAFATELAERLWTFNDLTATTRTDFTSQYVTPEALQAIQAFDRTLLPLRTVSFSHGYQTTKATLSGGQDPAHVRLQGMLSTVAFTDAQRIEILTPVFQDMTLALSASDAPGRFDMVLTGIQLSTQPPSKP